MKHQLLWVVCHLIHSTYSLYPLLENHSGTACVPLCVVALNSDVITIPFLFTLFNQFVNYLRAEIAL